MIPEEDKRYLLRYEFAGKTYEDVGTFVATVLTPHYFDVDCVEYKFKVDGGHIVVKENEIIRRIATTEESLAQYHWLKENSKRNK
jgi:hypothetical protein